MIFFFLLLLNNNGESMAFTSKILLGKKQGKGDVLSSSDGRSKKNLPKKKNEKKVRFNDNKALGGAIKGVHEMATETKTPDLSAPLKKSKYVSYAGPLSTYMRSVHADMIPKNQFAYFQYQRLFEADGESAIQKSLTDAVSGKGASHDHPIIQRAVVESLKHKPDLLHTYLNGRVRS